MGRSRAVSVMLWALSENENAPNNRQIFRIRTEPSESIVSTSRLDGPCDFNVGIAVPCCSTKTWGDANQQCTYDTKCRLSENSGPSQEGPNERGAQLVRRLLGGEEPLDKCN